MKTNGAKYSSENCVKAIGNRFDLILVASMRIRELKNSHRSKLNTGEGPISTALEEIEEGLITRDYIKRLRK